MIKQTKTGGWYSTSKMTSRTLTVEVHVPGVIAVLVLPDGLPYGAHQ